MIADLVIGDRRSIADHAITRSPMTYSC